MPRGEKIKGLGNRNENKYQQMKKDWGKSVTKAIGTRNYREAIMTEASILEDRLVSFLYKVGAFDSKKTDDDILKTRFDELLRLWKKNAREPLEDKFVGDLYQAVADWAKSRNRITHGGGGSIKSLPGKEHPDPAAFEIFARKTAIEGERVVKSVMNWYGREKGRRRREGIPLD